MTALGFGEDSSTPSRNLLYNSSFELGTKGWDSVRNIVAGSGQIDFSGPGMVLDESTAYHGSRCVKLFSSQVQFSRLVSPEFKLTPKKTYTASFWGKSEPANLPVQATIVAQGRNGQTVARFWKEGPLFLLDKEWRRYSFSFSAGQTNTPYYFLKFEPGSGDTPRPAASFWIDAVQLEEGLMTDYIPAAKVETAVNTPEEVVGTDEVKGQISVISYEKDRVLDVKLKLIEGYPDQPGFEQTLRYALIAGKPVGHDFSFKGLRFGPTSIVAAIESTTNQAASAFLVRFHPAAPFDREGFNTGCNGKIIGNEIGSSLLTDAEGDSTARANHAALAGGVFRAWANESTWKVLEQEQGKYDWKRLDRIVSELTKRHVEPLLELGGDLSAYTNGNSLPDWVKNRDRNNTPMGTLLPGATHNHKANLPQLEDWRAYVGAVSQRYKGRVKYYEIANEPNCSLPPKVYLEYLQSACEEIRKADPEAKIVGISATEDLGGHALEYIKETLGIGAGKHLDIVSFHPYGTRMDDSTPVSAMTRVRQDKDAIKQAGLDNPLWNTETFYLNTIPQGKNFVLESILPRGAISRRLLIDMGEGVSVSVPLLDDEFFVNANRSHTYWIWRERRQPSEIFAEQNMAASFLTGAVPLKTLELPGDILCYLFKKGDKLRAGIWGKTDKKILFQLKAPGSSSLSSYDVFGNALQSDVSEINLEIGRIPQYLEWKGCDAEAAVKAIQEGKIHIENDLKIKLAPVLKPGENSTVVLSFKNTEISKLQAVEDDVASVAIDGSFTTKASHQVSQ